MAEELKATLRAHFGFDAFRPGQLEATEHLLAGRHTLAVMPTGSGKSLIYQLAALHRPGVTLVISPLIALMKDQVDGLIRRSIPATFINSTVPTAEQERRLGVMAEGAFRLVYVAPERLRSLSFQRALARVTVGLLAVDEAHCISQWGHDFRPDYLQLAAARARMGDPVTVALTATATPQVQEDIVRLLRIPSAARLIIGFNRPNLTFEVRATLDLSAKLRALRDLLTSLKSGAAILYTGTRRDAEEVAEFVRTVLQIPSGCYHAGLEGLAREQIQDAFLRGAWPVIVATNAFGMGIDRGDVRLVVHFSLPGTLEAYYQEAGRAGRDGEAARAVLLYDPGDRALQESLIESDAISLEDVRTLYGALQTYGAGERWVSSGELSRVTGLHGAQVRVCLADLEASGIVERLGDAGVRTLLRVGPWRDEVAQRITDAVQERTDHRRSQLEEMIAYAESGTCRRRVLLDHFGERSSTAPLRCCDNCLSGEVRSGQTPYLSPVERAALRVLDVVRQEKCVETAQQLARMLREPPTVENRGLDGLNPSCARTSDLSMPEIEALIDQLVCQGYLGKGGVRQRALRLTFRGEAALAGQPPITLHLPMRSEREAGGTVALTARMLAAGLAPAQIAFQRGLSETAVRVHLSRMVDPAVVSSSPLPQPLAVRVRAALSDADLREATDPIRAFLTRSHPRSLSGPWHQGWALDSHTRFTGPDWSRGLIGESVYRLKYLGDSACLQTLVAATLDLCAEHPELADADAIVPVPSSTLRDVDPVGSWASALSQQFRLPVASLLGKTRRTALQKEMSSQAQKRSNVAGAFVARGEVSGKRLLVLDDLYDSGATLEEVTRALQRAGAARVCVLTLTRTIHMDA